MVTPHVSWYTADTMERYLTAAILNCRRVHDGLSPYYLVEEPPSSDLRPRDLPRRVGSCPNRPVSLSREGLRMPIAINPEHVDLADSVRSLVARVAPSDVLHEALEATAVTNPPPYWKAAAEQGLQGVHLAESVGGQGFGILELAIVLAEFGYGAVPGPFVPSAIASALISAHDPDSELLHRSRRRRHDRRLRHRLRPDRHPPRRRAGDPRRGACGAGRRAGVAVGAARRHRFR